MTDQNRSAPLDRDEIELLLPWYVTGQLDASEQARMDAALAQTHEFDAQLATLREDMDATVRANEALPSPSREALDTLMTRIAEEPARRPLQAATGGLLATVERFLHGLTPGRLGFAAMAAAAVIVLQTGFIGSSLLQSPGKYQLAGEDVETTTKTAGGTILLIAFTDTASVAEVTTFLEANDVRIVGGPINDMFYKVRIGEEVLTESARDALIARLGKQVDLIAMILPSQ